MKPRLLDGAVLLCAAAVTVVCAVRVYGGRGGELRLRIQGTGGVWVYPLRAGARETERAEIPGPLGVTVVEISGGAARIVSSPCANKTCIASGDVHGRGQWIACLPNAVSLAVGSTAAAANGAAAAGGPPFDAAAW